MKERILAFLQSENKSTAQFAEEIGVQPSGISHILSGRNNPSLDFVIKMLAQILLIVSRLVTVWSAVRCINMSLSLHCLIFRLPETVSGVEIAEGTEMPSGPVSSSNSLETPS